MLRNGSKWKNAEKQNNQLSTSTLESSTPFYSQYISDGRKRCTNAAPPKLKGDENTLIT